MNFILDNVGTAFVIETTKTKFDSQISAHFKRLVLEADFSRKKALIINLHNVAYVDSAGLGALLTVSRELGRRKIRVIICSIQNTVLKMLKIAHIEELFEFEVSLDEALKDFK